MKVLVIEDDERTAAFTLKGLKESGYVVHHAADGTKGLLLAGSERYDALIVDRMLPGRDGLELIAILRAAGNRTPALILSALGSVNDRVRGLKVGGDDYLVKPFALAELLARVEALIRRSQTAGEVTKLEAGDLQMDLLARAVRRGGSPDRSAAARVPPAGVPDAPCRQVVTRTMLLENVWDYHFDPQTNVVDVHIARLRQKIDREFAQPLIHTVRGAGYCLRA